MNTADLFTVNLSDCALKLLVNRCKSSIDENILTNVTTCLYGQLSVDYCEYRFLTMRPIVDSLQFKLISSVGFHPLLDNVNLSLSFDVSATNILVSQSALIAIKQLENEWITCENVSPHYYLIHNDTNMSLNVKQFDTEETCLLKSGTSIGYTWRTHKKAQLMQLYLPKYRLVSRSFQIGEDGPQELVFNLQNTEGSFFVTCLIFVESKVSLLSPFHAREESVYLKKKVVIQSKFVICNYLHLAIDDFSLTYSCNGHLYELTLADSIKEASRSETTYELIQSTLESSLEVDAVKINGLQVVTKKDADQLKEGVLCRDTKLGISFWLNVVYEQVFKSSVNKENVNLTQWSLVVTPIFVFCSYLPFQLSVEILDSKSVNLIKSNSISYLSYLKEDSNELTVKFDQLSGSPDEKASSLTNLSWSCAESKNNWFDMLSTKMLRKDNFNVSCCDASNKRLVFTSLFKYMSQDGLYDSEDQIVLNIFTSFMTESARLGSFQESTHTNIEKIVSIGSDESQLRSEFEIIKKRCWPFSKTIRVDLKPICLFVNKTCYYIKITEQYEDKHFTYTLDSNGGQLCMSNLGNLLNEKNEQVLLKRYVEYFYL